MASAGGARYAHTNLIARDWRRLVDFYQTVFGCVPFLRHGTSAATGWSAARG